MLFRPHAGAIKFGGHSPADNDIFYFPPVVVALLTSYFVFRISYFLSSLLGILYHLTFDEWRAKYSGA